MFHYLLGKMGWIMSIMKNQIHNIGVTVDAMLSEDDYQITMMQLVMILNTFKLCFFSIMIFHCARFSNTWIKSYQLKYMVCIASVPYDRG